MFRDRIQAGARLAAALEAYRHRRPVIIGLARGGVAVAAEIAHLFRARLDLIVVRKIAHPLWPEYAIGAVTESGPPVWGRDTDAASGFWQTERAGELQQLARQMRGRYLGSRDALPLHGSTVILVDDGIATGLTMLAAVREARRRGARTVVAAAPVAPSDVRSRLAPEVDDLVVVYEPAMGFGAVAQFYEQFHQVTDEEVRQLIRGYQPGDTPEAIDLPSLNAVLATVDQYPVTSVDIARRARRQGAPASVVGFFESIPGGTVFDTKADVLNRSLGAEKIIEDEQIEPYEHPHPDD